MRSSNVSGDGGVEPEPFNGPSRSGSEAETTPLKKQPLAGPLSGLKRDERHPLTSADTASDPPASDVRPEADRLQSSVSMPFIVDYESRSITKFGRPCLVARNGKMIPLGPREFNAGALLIEHMGQYVSIAKLCSHLGCDAAQVPEIMTQVRRALGLGSSQNPRGSSLVLMPDAKPVRGYGIFIAPHGHDTYTPDASPRGTLEALLSDIEGGAGGLQVLSIEQNMAVVRLEDLKARLYFGSIKSRAPVRFYVNAMPEPLPADQATNVHDVMIGWDASRGCTRRSAGDAPVSLAMLCSKRRSPPVLPTTSTCRQTLRTAFSQWKARLPLDLTASPWHSNDISSINIRRPKASRATSPHIGTCKP